MCLFNAAYCFIGWKLEALPHNAEDIVDGQSDE